MLTKKIGFLKRLGNRIRVRACTSHGSEPFGYECLSRSDHGDNKQGHDPSCPSTPRGCIALYVGEERRRFVVRTAHLSHPLFQMLLEKTEEEFGFVQKDKLVIPCTIDVFREVVRAVQCNKGKFDLRYFVEQINFNAT